MSVKLIGFAISCACCCFVPRLSSSRLRLM